MNQITATILLVLLAYVLIVGVLTFAVYSDSSYYTLKKAFILSLQASVVIVCFVAVVCGILWLISYLSAIALGY